MLKHALTLTTIAALTACGGGGGSSSNDLISGTIQGLGGVDYRTETQSGKLSSQGEYKYKDGESLTLLLGETEIGGLKVAGDSTVIDVLNFNRLPEAPAQVRQSLRMFEYTRERIQTAGTITFTKANVSKLHFQSNVARLLIAMDDDNDSNNGFDVSNHADAIAGLDLDLNVSLYEFASNNDALAFQHATGVSLAMDDARPLREAYAMADLSITVPVRESEVNGRTFTYNDLGQVTATSEEQTSDSITEYDYSYSNLSSEYLTRELNAGPNSDSSSANRDRLFVTRSFTDFGLIETETREKFVRNNIFELESYTYQTNTYLDDRVFTLQEQTVSHFDTDNTVDYSSSSRFTYDNDQQLTSNLYYAGNTVASEVFEYGTGNIQYDDQGRITRSEYENLNSNTMTTSSYDYAVVEGNQVNTKTRIKDNGDKETIKESFDSNGVLFERVITQLTNHVATKVTTVSYQYDDSGRIDECGIDEDLNADGTADRQFIADLTYSTEGLKSIYTAHDTNADGTLESESTLTAIYGDDAELLTGFDNSYTYGNVAANGISYLINEYSNPVYDGDRFLAFGRSSTKCEYVFSIGQNF